MARRAADNGKYLTLGEAAKHAPGRPNARAIWRWCRHGLRTRGGRRVHLRHIRVGGRVYTTREWLDAFLEQLADAEMSELVEHSTPKPILTTHAIADATLATEGM